MTVLEFNRKKGLYCFQLNDIETALHSHPVIEILVAEAGTFSVSTANSSHHDLTLAVIAPNIPHCISAAGCQLRIMMIEYHNRLMSDILSAYRITLTDGFYFDTKPIAIKAFYSMITQRIVQQENFAEYDERIQKVIRYIDDYEPDYQVMIPTLRSIANLSESRLSHLFKENVGISLKKYLVWSKLKSAIEQHLDTQEDLLTSLLASGFYDQPHFIRAFKSMLGVNPAKVYNSRIIQG